MIRWVYWPICAVFGHEAMGLLATGFSHNDRDTYFCACHHNEMTGSYVASRLLRLTV